MSTAEAPKAIGPDVYAAWRATPLGAITEALEQRLILGLIGEVHGARVLDAGCGDGMLVCALASLGAEVTGADPDAAMLAAARLGADKAGIRAAFVEARVEQLPFPSAAFDVVTAVTVLCFVRDAAGAMREMARVLRPGGRVVIGELGCWNPWAAIRRLRGWFGSATWKSVRFRTAAELRLLAEQAGLTVNAIRGAVFYPPIGIFARSMAPIDAWLGHRTAFGAAFIALSAVAAGDKRSR